MKKKQAIFILLISCSLVLTLLLGSIIFYFVENSDITDANAADGDLEEQPSYVDTLAVTHNGDIADREVRGVWISTVYNINFPSKAGLSSNEQKAELDAIVANAKAANLNTIFFQVRPTSDALYKSDIYPTSAYLVGKQGAALVDDFDPLEYIIKRSHESNIELHAWINPFRITAGSASTIDADVKALADTNPAVMHKDWTVAYDDGKLYFDPGIPEARKLIISGAVEIVQKYDVDGIHIDDYFYPYPVYVTDENGKKTLADFNDANTYNAYGGGMEKGDWRRQNINAFVGDLRDAVKAARADCEFGVSCAGIWANAANLDGGSDTNGMQSYFDTYSDSKYWIENELVDYICPQIYWEMSHKAAPFDVLCKWWSSVVDGTRVKLYIGHALYKNESWSDKTEITRQVEFARSWYGYKGSVFFGYDQIEDNKDGMRDKLANIFYEDYYHPYVAATGESVTFGSPQPSAMVNVGNTYILGKSDPGYPLYYNGKKLARTQNGYFNMYVPISAGNNSFEFTQNGKTTVITLSTISKANTKDNSLGKMMLKSVYPSEDIITAPGGEISLSCTAPAGSTVTVTLGAQSVTLSPQGSVASSPKYLPQTYKGTLKLKSDVPADAITDLGSLVFNAKLSGETATETAADVKLKPDNYNAFIEVVNDYSHLKISPTSSFYNDYLPSSVGMRDYVVSLADGYYKLRFGGYIARENAKFVEGNLLDGKILSAECEADDTATRMKFAVTENVPVNAYYSEGKVIVKFYNVSSEYAQALKLSDNPLFADCSYDMADSCITYTLQLKDADNFYGFTVKYTDGAVVLDFRNPIKLNLDSEAPLSGITVVVDAGHGGNDEGALGFLSDGQAAMNEKDLNLLVAKAAQKYLSAYGATVIMTRNDDVTMELEERMKFLNDNYCDLSVSIHHNSLDYVSNVTRVRGLLGLWWNESGRLLAKSVSATVADGLNRYERTPSTQKLAMCRNHKFPSTLIELGFITSAEEYEYITQPENIDIAGRAVADGVISFYAAQQKYV